MDFFCPLFTSIYSLGCFMFVKKKIIILCFLFNLLPYIDAAASSKPTEENEIAIQKKVLFYINEYRQQHGLSKLKMNNHIVTQAKQHSQDMANHHMTFGHKDFNKRIAKLRSQIKNVIAGAENVAYNYKDAHDVVNQWVRSFGHKRNIEGHYNLTGIGVARDTQGKLYFTQIFILTK